MSKNKKILFVSILCGLALTLMPSIALADACTDAIGRTAGACAANPGSTICAEATAAQATACAASNQPSTPSSGGSAQTSAPVKLTNPLGTADLPTLIGRVISAALGIVGSIALLMFIYGGFLWLTAAGSEQKITAGKNVIVWAVIGLAVIFLSYTLVGFVIKGLTSTTPAGGGATSGGPTQSELQEIVCCYSCSGGKISNPFMTELKSCTTGNWVSGSCPSAGSACQ